MQLETQIKEEKRKMEEKRKKAGEEMEERRKKAEEKRKKAEEKRKKAEEEKEERRKKAEEEMKQMKMNEAKRPIEIWMFKHRFPDQMKEDIRQNVINSLKRKQDVNVKNLLHHLPEELRIKAKRFLYLDLLKKVSSFATINLVDKHFVPMHKNSNIIDFT